MKTLLHHPVMIYVAGGVAALCIMIIIDYLLGAEAEHLNAWVIINRLFGSDIGIPDSLAIKHLGLYGAALVMLFINGVFGAILIQGLRLFINLIHS